MAEPLKNLVTRAWVEDLGAAAAKREAAFDARRFTRAVFDGGWPARELKQRLRHVGACLYDGLPGNYARRMTVLMDIGPQFTGLPALMFPDVVEQRGLDHWDISMKALEVFTPLCSSEFAIRPFIMKDPVRAMAQMRKWSLSRNEHVRRLASEGCRPRLPWGMALPVFKCDPAPVLEILEVLRDDPSEYVRRSVANNLNDISKDHPDVLLAVAKRWLKESPSTARLLKHACRTLLKKGDQRALGLFGLTAVAHAKVTDLALTRRRIPIGGAVEFTFTVRVDGKKPADLRIEYAIDFLKSGGSHGRKVFKITERSFAGAETVVRRHRVQDMTTRVHVPGRHHLHVILNGVPLASAEFELTR